MDGIATQCGMVGGGALQRYLAKQSSLGAFSRWRLNESGVTAIDDIGSNNGTYTPNDGSSWTGGTQQISGQIANDLGAQGDGSTGYISIPDSASLDVTAELTIEGWVFTPSDVSVTQFLIHKEIIIPSFDLSYRLYYDSSNFIFYVSNDGSGTNRAVRRSSTIFSSTWYHVACVFDSSSKLDIYLDGVLANGSLLGSIPPSINSNNQDLTLFAREDSMGSFVGHTDSGLSNLAFYDKALSASEISDLYDAATL